MKELGLDTITVMKKLKHSLDPKYVPVPYRLYSRAQLIQISTVGC